MKQVDKQNSKSEILITDDAENVDQILRKSRPKTSHLLLKNEKLHNPNPNNALNIKENNFDKGIDSTSY